LLKFVFSLIMMIFGSVWLWFFSGFVNLLLSWIFFFSLILGFLSSVV
jgi:hypothetical protein